MTQCKMGGWDEVVGWSDVETIGCNRIIWSDSDSEADEQRVIINGSKEDTEINDQFFKTSHQIRESMQLLGDKVKQMEANQVKVLSTPLPEEGMKVDLQKLREDIKLLAKEIRAKLQSMEVKEDDDLVRSSVHVRMRKTQHGVLSQQFIELINQCNNVQTQYRDSNVKRIKRQLEITGHNVTDVQFDEMLESGQADVFTCNVRRTTCVCGGKTAF
ncbi:LOW QUALITY PROTEIN: syntaxin-4-like, partial [Ascaphus truei]|uniref:LOW QUALITY PROTEIN: syntaxin-4-like n=1 Tax=Ascaphus truei TaxID=8439 RepID=UPI003F5A5266